MYHAHFNGTHYEIGYRWGLSLAKRGNFLLDHIPFPITRERKAFAAACIPVYKKYFPEILEEIQGLSAGQGCNAEPLQTVLFSMYAMPPACSCSCFAVSNKTHILLGRNSDFLTALEKLNLNVIYHFCGPSFSFTGNTTSFLQIEDGVNEYGLAMGLTSVWPTHVQPGFHAGMLLRICLETCRSVWDAIALIQKLPISSAQTLTMADLSGDIAVLECNSQQTTILRPTRENPFVCATNIFSSPQMQSYTNSEIDNWQAQERYDTLNRTLQLKKGILDFPAAKKLLSGKNGFLCQYDRATGKDTVWSVLYDLKERAVYRAEGNPGRKMFKKDERLNRFFNPNS